MQNSIRTLRSSKPEKHAFSREVGMTSLLKVSELLSLKEGWHRIKWNLQAKVQHPEKRASSWEEKLSSLLDGEWAFAKYQRGMTQESEICVSRCIAPKNWESFWDERD